MRAEDLYTELELQELDREYKMDLEGRDCFMIRLEKQSKSSSSITSEAHRLTSEDLTKVSDKIKRMIHFEENRVHPNTKKAAWYDDVIRLNTDVLAYIGLNTLWGTKVQRSSLAPSKRMLEELWR